MDMETIWSLCEKNALRWTNHILVRLLQRNISIDDVKYSILNGEIIEPYPDDYPYPSCLILGLSIAKQNLHVVCGISQAELYLITAYYPDPKEWDETFKIRKGQK